jgi:outer membrane protein OmpA-like peptidoglycan-associated protein
MKILSKLFAMSAVLSAFNISVLGNSIPNTISEWGRVSIKTEPISGLATTFAAYDSFLGDIDATHGAWFLLEAAYDGVFSLNSQTSKDELEVAIFRAETQDFVVDLKTGNAFLLAFSKLKKGVALKLDRTSNEDEFPPELFQVLKGQYILVFVGGKTETLLDFTPELKASKSLEARKLLAPYAYVLKANEPVVKFSVRDAKTGLPVKAKINVSGLKKLDNVYNASDLTFDLVNGKKAQISFDAPGYFSQEMAGYEVVMGKNNVITVLVYPFNLSENMKLNGVQFEEGTDRFLASAYNDLDKLVSFLNANSSIDIEVQGHVNAVGNNSKGAQKLSERRAKAVKDYLVEKGIDSNRVQHVGYGNTEMVFQDPQTPEQEQANRRVEIKFLD